MLSVQLVDVSKCFSHPQALRMTKASSRNVGKLYTEHPVVHKESRCFYTATATESDVTSMQVCVHCINNPLPHMHLLGIIIHTDFELKWQKEVQLYSIVST